MDTESLQYVFSKYTKNSINVNARDKVFMYGRIENIEITIK